MRGGGRESGSAQAVVAGLIALEDQGDHGGKIGILGHAVTHAPAEQLGILALQQADEGALFGLAEMGRGFKWRTIALAESCTGGMVAAASIT